MSRAYRNELPPIEQEEELVRPFVETQLNGGMISVIDPADIPTSALSVAKNSRFRFGKCQRSPGNIVFGPTRPNGLKVMHVYSFKQHDGTQFLLRFTKSGIHKLTAGSWSALTGTLAGTDDDYFSVTFGFDQCVFANGVDYIQVINTGTNSFARLGNAPRFRYVAAFYNRIVAANYTEPGSENPELLGWSGDLNFTEWDPLVDISAGSGPLIENPSDTSDDITGLFAGPNLLIIPREKTIWLATKNPIADNPFNAFPGVSGHGSDAPQSISRSRYGLVFVDYRTKGVYVFKPSPNGPIDQADVISTAIKKDLFDSISNPADVDGSYDSLNDEYSIVVPQANSNTRKIWTYNFTDKAWSYDEKENVSGVFDPDSDSGVVTVGDLSGTIGSLTGTVGDLSRSISGNPTRVFTYPTGEIVKEDASTDTYNGEEYTTVLESKRYSIPTNDIYVVRLSFEFDFRRATTFRIYWSKDGKKTWNLGKSVTIPGQVDAKAVYFNKQIRCRKFEWKLEFDNGDWDLTKYEIHVYDSSFSSK